VIADKSVRKSSDFDTVFSIIVPTFNEEKYIGALLERLFSFVLDNFLIKVIVRYC
jgi:glycosyltransferase involved in cell wall biosynthesis